MSDRPLNVLVCGTRFGEHYLAALAQGGGRFRLAGILARGSVRSRALAERLEIPLYGSVAEVPDKTADIACVVVRTTLFAGKGSELAQALLDRGIHVLQEHPVHPGELARLRRTARAAGLQYHVNSFYPHLPAGRLFIDYASRARERRSPAFAEFTTSPQLLYSSLDILGRALGGLGGFRCDGPLMRTGEPSPFHAFQGEVAGVPFSLLLQSWLDPADPDHHSLVMHRMALGGPEGVVNLVNSFGPVVWTHALYAPDYGRDDAESSYLLSRSRFERDRYFTQPTAQPFGAASGGSVASVVTEQFPGAVHRALDELARAIGRPGSVLEQSDDYLLDLGQAWLTLMRLAGPPRHRAMPSPPPPFPDPIGYARENGLDG